MLLTVNKLNDVLSGVIGNEKYSLPYNSETHQSLLTLEQAYEQAETIEEVRGIIEKAKEAISNITTEIKSKMFGDNLLYNEKTQKFYLRSNNVTSSIPLPQVLADKIVTAIEKDLPYEPFIKAWMWFLKNPTFTYKKAQMFAKYITTTFVDQEQRVKLIEEGYSEEKATEMATFNDVSITKNGLLSTYKYAQIKYHKFSAMTGEVVDRYELEHDEETGEAKVKLPEEAEDYYLIPPIMGEGGDAYLCGDVMGHRIAVGKVHSLSSFDQINCQDGTFGGGGLHLGGLRYIQGYGGHGRLLLNAFVNPMDIGGFTDGGDGAIRTLRYFVHSAQFAPNKALYHESNYLEYGKAQWETMRGEAIAASEKKIEAILKLQDEINAL